MRSLARRLFAWGPALLLTAVVWLLSSMPDLRPPGPYFPHRDKVFHALQFGLMGFFYARAAALTWPRRLRRALLFGFALTAAMGLLDELHQAFVPGRDGDLLDWLADLFGAAVGGWLYGRVRSVWRRRARRADEVEAGRDEPAVRRTEAMPVPLSREE